MLFLSVTSGEEKGLQVVGVLIFILACHSQTSGGLGLQVPWREQERGETCAVLHQPKGKEDSSQDCSGTRRGMDPGAMTLHY